MAEQMIRIPLRLAQAMADNLRQQPYMRVADMLNELAAIKAEPPLSAAITTDPTDPDQGKTGSHSA